MNLCKSLFRSTPLGHEELRGFLKVQLVMFSIMNTITSIISLVQENTSIEEGAIVASLVLLWASFPIGMWGIYKENGGMTALYIIFGILCGIVRVVMSLIAAAVVAVSCQAEQMSFKGCFQALDSLSCLRYSNCTSDIIKDYNTISNSTIKCDAWGTDECSHAPSTTATFVTTDGRTILLVMNVFTACVPVYMAFLYFTRKEATKISFNGASDIHIESGEVHPLPIKSLPRM